MDRALGRFFACFGVSGICFLGFRFGCVGSLVILGVGFVVWYFRYCGEERVDGVKVRRFVYRLAFYFICALDEREVEVLRS